MPTTVTFGSRSAANDFRNKASQYLTPGDDRRRKTVVFTDETPDSVLQRATEAAGDSRRAEAEKAGQSSLTRREREEIDFSREGMNVLKARAIKGIAEAEGVTDWQQFADYETTVDENRAILKRASQEEGGDRGGRGQEARQIESQANARRARNNQVESAKPAAFRGDDSAQGFLEEEEQFNDDLFDISFSSTDDFGRTQASGTDVEELREVHEERSPQAQHMDETQHAQVTRDPIKWSNNKDEYDFPGVDTLDPEKKHESRSERAQEVDENERAPIAPSPAVWANDMDQYDLPGVDTPDDDSDDSLF